MDYFQELLSSYQLLKKRKFTVSYVNEAQQANPQGEAKAQQYISQAQSASQQPPPNNKVPVQEIPGTFVWVAVEGKSAGQVVFDGFPGPRMGKAMAVTGGGAAGKMNFVDFANLLGGGEQEQDPQAAQQQQDPTAMAAPQPMQPLPLSQDPIVQQALQSLHTTMQKLKGDLDTGSVRMEKGGTKLLDEAIKRFYWGGMKSGSFASKLDLAKIAYRMGGQLSYENMPPDFAAQGIQNLERVFNTFREIDSGKFNTEKAQELKDLIKLDENGTGMMLRTSPGSDNGMIIRWESADSFYGSLMTNLQDKLNRWGENQKDGTTTEDMTLPTGSLSGGGKNFNNLRGVVSEKFQAISVILRRAMTAEAMCQQNPRACKDAAANKTIALSMLRKLYDDNRDSLLPAFEIIDNLVNNEVPGDVETQKIAQEVMSVLDFLKIEFPRKLSEGAATPDDISRYNQTANMIVDRMITRLLRVDAKTVMLRNPMFVGETGQSEANSKKSDTTEFYQSLDEGIAALQRQGYDAAEAKSLLVPADSVIGMYGGAERFSALTGAPIEKVKEINKKGNFVLLNGIKSYTRSDPVSLGSGSVSEAFSKFTTQSPSINTFRARLNIDKNSFDNIAQEFAVVHEELENLKDPNKYPIKQGETLAGVVKKKIEDLGLARRYPGLSGKSQEQKLKNLTEIQRMVMFDKFESIQKKNPRAANNFMAMVIMSAAAADVNQQTEVRYLHTGETFSFNHNECVEGPLRGLKDGSTKLVRAGGTIHVVDSVTEEPLLTYSTAIDNGKIKGAVHLPVPRMKKLAKVRTQSVQASTDLMINFLMGQKQLLEQLLSKYQ